MLHLVPGKRALLLVTASATILSGAHAQTKPNPGAVPWWADTVGESPIYPVGDAAPVYRAVLDLLYIDGDQRPPIIVMHDSAENLSGGPCGAKCDHVWPHKSKIGEATILSFNGLTRRRPAIRNFGYPIPIVFLSNDDIQRMEADGGAFLMAHPQPPGTIPLWLEFRRKYPTAWGFLILSKVGFDPRHTQALVEVDQWCGEVCRSDEILFLRQTAGRWTIVERIPNSAERGPSPGNIRYTGPAGSSPKESELVAPPGQSGSISEFSARTGVYRAVLDSLYTFAGESPKTIVLTDYFPTAYGPLPPHKSAIDPAVVRRYAFLELIRAPLDTKFDYHIPIARLSRDSVPLLTKIGDSLDRIPQTGAPFWLAFRQRYPNAWGTLGLSRIAFNAARTQALVYSNHACGSSCLHGDTWFLERSGTLWHIVERIPRDKQSDVELEPLRYLGADANPNSYRPRRVRGVVTDADTRRLVPFLAMTVRRNSMTGALTTDSITRTDSAGRYTLVNLPLSGGVSMKVGCPDQSQHDSIWVATITVTPGLDTTVNPAIDFKPCLHLPPVVPVNPLLGAQAFIGPDEARFVFPRQKNNSYSWDVPVKGAYAGSAEYMWEVQWDIPGQRDGTDPYLLWLTRGWKPGGPHRGSLKALIAGQKLDPMINCVTCDGAVFADPETDHKNVFATVENGQLIFIVRGADAMRRIFPAAPSRVTFSATVRQTPQRDYGPGETRESLTVMVNCRNSDESAEARHRCDAHR